jgi:hypothetical protein
MERGSYREQLALGATARLSPQALIPYLDPVRRGIARQKRSEFDLVAAAHVLLNSKWIEKIRAGDSLMIFFTAVTPER